MTDLVLQLGPLSLSVSGEGPVCRAITSELSGLPQSMDEEAYLRILFVDDVESSRESLRVGRWRLADNYVAGTGHGYDFAIRHHDDHIDVSIAPHKSNDVGALRHHYRQAWDWNFLSPAETTAKNIMYNLFDLVTGAALLGKGASYLHASTCAREDQAVALIAWGGVGKTTSVLKLVTEQNWRFMSDDLGLLDSGGKLWRTPKNLQIYAYNVEGQPQLFEQLMEGRGPVDRVNWHWRLARFGGKKVRRRIGARDFFGPEGIVDAAPLTQAVFLERADVPELSWHEIDAQELAMRSATILVEELNTLFELVVAAESHGVDVGFGTLEELRQKSKEIIYAGVDGLPMSRLRIPFDAGPDDLADALERHFEK